MKNNIKKYLPHLVSLSIILIPMLLLADSSQTIKNPLGDNNTEVKNLLVKIMDLVAMVGGIVVVFFIILSGFKIVMARGNPGDLEKAKDMFLATIIGGAVLLGADVIAHVVVGTIDAIKKP